VLQNIPQTLKLWVSYCRYQSRHCSACFILGHQIYSSFVLRPSTLFIFVFNCNTACVLRANWGNTQGKEEGYRQEEGEEKVKK
jgi:hypothetical protein